MTSQLMDMVAKVELFRVVGIAFKAGESPVIHVDEGRLYAATSESEAIVQARTFWTQEMGFDSYSGAHAKAIRKVGNYRVVLVKED